MREQKKVPPWHRGYHPQTSVTEVKYRPLGHAYLE